MSNNYLLTTPTSITNDVKYYWAQEERREKEKQVRDQELEQYRRNRELEAADEAQFQTYARDVIQHCEQRGRNTYPLRRAAATGSRQVLHPTRTVSAHHQPASNLLRQFGR